MKKLLFVVGMFILSQIVSAHDQAVHQYLTREAYKLLKLDLGKDIPIMANKVYIGAIGPDQLAAFQAGSIERGAYREDTEDPIFLYSNINVPTLWGSGDLSTRLEAATILRILSEFGSFDPFITSTHFWKADNGNLPHTLMHCKSLTTDFWMEAPNSYQKLLLYANGGWDANIEVCVHGLPTHSDGTGFCANQ